MGPLRWLDWYGDGSLYVVDLALACCAVEVEAAGWRRRVPPADPDDLPVGARSPITGAATSPALGGRVGALDGDAAPALGTRTQVVVVVSGTVTDRLVPAVLGLIDGVIRMSGHAPTVVSFGACASSGGPYWDSYAVTKGVDEVVPVDIYVPGCPPPPEALEAVLDEVAGRVRT